MTYITTSYNSWTKIHLGKLKICWSACVEGCPNLACIGNSVLQFCQHKSLDLIILFLGLVLYHSTNFKLSHNTIQFFCFHLCIDIKLLLICEINKISFSLRSLSRSISPIFSTCITSIVFWVLWYEKVYQFFELSLKETAHVSCSVMQHCHEPIQYPYH